MPSPDRKHTECDVGAPLHTRGCTWRRHPVARLVYGEQLVRRGFVRPPYSNSAPEQLQRRNAAVFAAVFSAHPVAVPWCGGA